MAVGENFHETTNPEQKQWIVVHTCPTNFSPNRRLPLLYESKWNNSIKANFELSMTFKTERLCHFFYISFEFAVTSDLANPLGISQDLPSDWFKNLQKKLLADFQDSNCVAQIQ